MTFFTVNGLKVSIVIQDYSVRVAYIIEEINPALG